MEYLLDDLKHFLLSHVVAAFVSLCGLLFVFITSYITEKGKLKALRSENKKLVEETEKIKSHYSKELEEVKREHQLDIAKRKYQYESKKEQYIK